MWRVAVVVGLLCGMVQVASANPITEAGETVADTTLDGARWTGHTVGAGVTWVLVNADKGLHWTWDVAHNQFLHPLVGALTLGNVDLSSS